MTTFDEIWTETQRNDEHIFNHLDLSKLLMLRM